MEAVTHFLAVCAGILLIGATAELIFNKTGVPDALWPILAGAALGPIFGVVGPGEADAVIPFLGALALVIVLFDSGTRLKLGDFASAPRAIPLALLSFSLAALTVAAGSMAAAATGWLPPDWTWLNGLLLGAILGGPSCAVLSPMLDRTRLDPRVAGLLGMESALSDMFCVLGASALAGLMLAEPSGAASKLWASLGIGLGAGALAGLVWMLFLRALRATPHAYPITLAMLLIMYVVIERAGGSPVLGVLSLAVVLGNAPAISRLLNLPPGMELGQDVLGFHRQMVFIVKSFFFILMGTMLFAPMGLLTLGALLAAALLLMRVPPVQVAAFGSSLSHHERMLATVAVPRGLASVVMATMIGVWIPGGSGLYAAIAFPCILFTLLLFAVGFPVARRQIAAVLPQRTAPLWRPERPLGPPPPGPVSPPPAPPPRPPINTGGFRW